MGGNGNDNGSVKERVCFGQEEKRGRGRVEVHSKPESNFKGQLTRRNMASYDHSLVCIR